MKTDRQPWRNRGDLNLSQGSSILTPLHHNRGPYAEISAWLQNYMRHRYTIPVGDRSHSHKRTSQLVAYTSHIHTSTRHRHTHEHNTQPHTHYQSTHTHTTHTFPLSHFPSRSPRSQSQRIRPISLFRSRNVRTLALISYSPTHRSSVVPLVSSDRMVLGKCGVGGVGDEVSAEAAVHRVQLMAFCLGVGSVLSSVGSGCSWSQWASTEG